MRDRNERHGCLIIGRDHAEDLVILMRNAALHGRIYDATK
jgi:hypothetical protein